jgi:hypothetical protein
LVKLLASRNFERLFLVLKGSSVRIPYKIQVNFTLVEERLHGRGPILGC